MSHNILPINTECENGSNAFAKWLVLELAATLSGNKPSTVLTFSDVRFMPLFKMWHAHGPETLRKSNLRYFVLRETTKSVTVLFYRPDSFWNCITENDNREFLERSGYPVEKGIEECLLHLREKFQQTCPHEVGILLGIPLKDVLGFMGLTQLPLTCRGLWCVYGDPGCSLSAMQCFADDRKRVAALLKQGCEPLQLLCG
jgi:hypothetical protein